MAEKYWHGYASSLYAGDWNWDTDAFSKTLDNAAAVDKGGGLVGIPITGHPFAAGDTITLDGTSNYDGAEEIVSETADEVVITATYAAETFAGTETATSAVTDSNWKLCSDDSNTTKPAAADIVHIDSRAYKDSSDNYQDIDTNCDGTGTGTPDLGGLYVRNNNSIIGTSSEYLEIECSGGDIIFEGTGTLYLKLSAGTGNDADCQRFVINTATGTAHLASLENDDTNVGLFADVIGLAGDLYIDDDCAVAALKSLGPNLTVYGGTGILDDKADTYCTITQSDGVIYWDSTFATVNRYGGTFYWGTDLAAAETSMNGALLYQVPGAGNFFWQCKALSSQLNQFLVYGGKVNARGPLNSEYPKQIGSAGNEISEIWPGGEVDLDNGMENIEFGGTSAIENHGGKLVVPAREQVSW